MATYNIKRMRIRELLYEEATKQIYNFHFTDVGGRTPIQYHLYLDFKRLVSNFNDPTFNRVKTSLFYNIGKTISFS